MAGERMSREWTLAEQERDEYEASMLQHADDLALFNEWKASGVEMVCERHNFTVPFGTLRAECEDCYREFVDRSERERFDSPHIPVRRRTDNAA